MKKKGVEIIKVDDLNAQESADRVSWVGMSVRGYLWRRISARVKGKVCKMVVRPDSDSDKKTEGWGGGGRAEDALGTLCSHGLQQDCTSLHSLTCYKFRNVLLHTLVLTTYYLNYCCLSVSSKQSPLTLTKHFYPENHCSADILSFQTILCKSQRCLCGEITILPSILHYRGVGTVYLI